jgi:hypothetical protein
MSEQLIQPEDFMQLVFHATEVINGRTYTTKTFALDAKDCRTAQDAEGVMVKLIIFADENFARVRKRLKSVR